MQRDLQRRRLNDGAEWKESGVDVVNLILAALLLLTPMMFGFASDHVAAPNAWVSGIVIGAVAIAALTKFAEWEEWINLLLGVWVLSFSAQTTARWAHVGIGLIVAVLAGLRLWLMHQTRQQRVGAQR
jgi:hypothetical protein